MGKCREVLKWRGLKSQGLLYRETQISVCKLLNMVKVSVRVKYFVTVSKEAHVHCHSQDF